MRRLIALLFLLVVLPCQAEVSLRIALDALHERVAERIVAGQYDSVLADADRYLKTGERLSDGRWKLAILYGGLDIGFVRAASTPDDWEARAAALRALARRHPDSPNVWTLIAQLEQSHAWAVRGEGFADDVSAADLRVFKSHIAAENALLEEHPVPSNPAWQDLRIQAAADGGESQAGLDRIFAAAIDREPGYHSTWFTRLNYAQPKWGGSQNRMIALINRGAGVTSPAEGRGMMARLLQIAAELGERDLLDSPAIAWTTVKTSYDDLLKRYPDDWNAQWFFFEAATHGDKAEAKHLLTFVKEPPSPAILGSNLPLYLLCVDWAKGKIPGFIVRNPAAGTEKLIE